MVVIACCTAGAALMLRRPIRHWRLNVAFKQAILLANANHSLGVPLACDGDRFASATVGILPAPRTLLEAAEKLANIDSDDAIRSAHAFGVANLITGRPEDAVRRFESIPQNRRDASVWTNLAVAEVMVGTALSAREHLLAALAAADHARVLDTDASSPLFLRARALELLGLRRAASAAWRHYLLRDSSSSWAALARAHAATLDKTTDDSTAWQKATAHFEKLSDEELARLTRTYPQQARTYAESIYLSAWADFVEAGNLGAASAMLSRIAVIAEALRLRSGEQFLTDVLRSIDYAAAAPDANRLHVHARAFLRYRSGRYASRDQNAGQALPAYEAATQLFASVDNPMAAMSECYTAIALIDENRAPEARRRLIALITAERAARSHHDALVAFALYHVALCDAADGSWSEALTAAGDSLSMFNRLGEFGFAGTVEALISQSYDFLGQRYLALSRGTHALTLLARSGDSRRMRITVGGLSRSALRHGEWELARVLIGTERTTFSGSIPRDDCDMFLRLAASEYHLGHTREWRSALAEAHKEALKVSDPAIRRKLIADTDAVSGSLIRRQDPRRALSSLSAAIEFQEGAKRALLLPELYLQRGRVSRDLGRLDDAQRDFERGMERLEQQRVHTPDADLRAGIFDDAGELFTDAVSLALARHDAAGVFGYVERGRARAILEEIFAKEGKGSLSRPISIDALRESLPAGSLLVEYQILEDAIAIVTIDHAYAILTRVPIRREVLEREVQSFIDALTEHRDRAIVDASSRTLYEWLLKPLQKQLSRSRSLIVVPDAKLQQLPFAALMNGSTGRYLIEDYVLLTTPSASVYAGVHRSGPCPTTRSPSGAALFANPLLAGGPFENLSLLPASEQEVNRIARMYSRQIVVTGLHATVSQFISIADAYDVVHFAGHAVTRPSEPWHSALLFAPEDGGGGLLTVQKIAQLSFRHMRVVVLASCSTLRGHTAGVEGVPSVARAFLVAGVPSVVGTLWDVDDNEIGPLMAMLHDRLVNGAAPADALRAAQIGALRSDVLEFRHPAYWAAFQLLDSLGCTSDESARNTKL